MGALTIINNEQRKQFQATLDGELPYLEYRMSDGNLVLMHTEVPDNLSGRGVGSSLVTYAFHYARERGIQVKVYCPFVRAWLQRHPDQKDIVAAPG